MKNILKNLYEGFFDDLDKLNKDDGFRGTNANIYDQHDYILNPDKNPEFFEGLCNMCKEYYPNLPSNENGFTQEDLDKITYISDIDWISFFQDVTSLDELQYFHNLEIIKLFSFTNCIKLKSVIFPENIKKIYYRSFYRCSSLKEIIIPERFKDNMKNIFYNVDLTKINITYI